jgi:hypothetical protein
MTLDLPIGNIRIRTCISHREKTLLGVLLDEVLIREPITIDGFTASALYMISLTIVVVVAIVGKCNVRFRAGNLRPEA